MSDAIWVSIIAAIPPTIVATIGLLASRKNGAKIADVHISLNSRLDALLEEHGEAAQMREQLAGNQRRDDLAVQTRSDTADALAESNVNIAAAEARTPKDET